MDPKLYDALAKGDVAALLEQQFEPILHSQTTYQKYTSLHVAVQYEKEGCVKAILDSCPSSLPLNVNTNGDTALHMAARQGQGRIIKLIIDKAKSLGEEDIENGGKESIVRPLIMVGTTAMHAAVMSGSYGIINRLHRVKPSISKEANKHGWTPLHHAAYVRSTRECCEALIENDSTVAYILDKKGMSPLHVAAGVNNYEAIEVILKHCPDCWQVLDHRGRNYLHIAALRRCPGVLKRALKSDITTKESLNLPDIGGNTPLHLAVIYKAYDVAELLSKDNRVSSNDLNKQNRTALDVLHEKDWLPEEFFDSWRKSAAAAKVLKERSIIYQARIKWEDLGLPRMSEREEMKKKTIGKLAEKMRNTSNNHLVVAALIATVTFAAGFTIPGGFQSNNGQPILLEKAMFKVFAISNTIAMVLSTLAVLFHFFMNLADDDTNTFFFVANAFRCTSFAILSMMLAFITGTYVVLSPSLGLAITTCVIGSSFYLLCYYPLYFLRNSIFLELLSQSRILLPRFIKNPLINLKTYLKQKVRGTVVSSLCRRVCAA